MDLAEALPRCHDVALGGCRESIALLLAGAALFWQVHLAGAFGRYIWQAAFHKIYVNAEVNPALAAALRDWPQLRQGRDFRQMKLEDGSTPLFALSHGAVQLLTVGPDSRAGIVVSHSEPIEGVPGAVLLRDILSASECDKLIVAAESMGYSEGNSTPRRNRHARARDTTLCMWLADAMLNDRLYDRVRWLLPQSGVEGAVGLNSYWRFYKSARGHGMAPHVDRSRSGMVQNAFASDSVGDRRSLFSLVLYLSDGFEGGEIVFYMPSGDRRPVKVPRGGAIVFPQDGLVHGGATVVRGTKYILRTDILYPSNIIQQLRGLS